MQWSKAQYFQNALKASALREVQRTVLPPAQTLNTKFGRVALNAVPQTVIKCETDPLAEGVKAQKPTVLWLQADPLLLLQRLRMIRHTARYVDAPRRPQFVMKDTCPHDLEECTVGLNAMDVLAKGKEFKYEESFILFMHDSVGPQKMQTMTQQLTKAITENVYNQQSRWPYLTGLVHGGILSRLPVVLGDLPEVQLRCIVANSLPLQEVQYIFRHVVGVLKDHYSKRKSFLSAGRVTRMLYSHMFSARDKFIAASLRETALKYEVVEAWIGAEHVSPVTDLWNGLPNWDEAIHIPPRKEGESDQELICKHVLLDLLHDSKVWQHPALPHPFPYLFASPDSQTLEVAKKTFFEALRTYKAVMRSHVKIPEELQQRMRAAEEDSK